MNTNGHQSNDDTRQAPERLVQALNRLESSPIGVPPEIDDAILRAAREHLRPAPDRQTAVKSGPPRPGWMEAGVLLLTRSFSSVPRSGRFLPWAAVAVAVVLMVGWLAQSVRRPAGSPRVEDLNRDGQVDILDAYLLARQVERGARLDLRLDLNGDGDVDRHDADLIAMRAVTLELNNPL